MVKIREIADIISKAVAVRMLIPFLCINILYSTKYAMAVHMKNIDILNQSAFIPRIPV